MNDIEISVIIPVYNEEKNIAAALRRTREYLQGLGTGFEIIAVNDGSRDASLLAVRDEAAGNNSIRLITSDTNRGKGFAVRSGMLAARGRYRFFLDADLAVPVETISVFLGPLRTGGTDIVIGTRKTKDAVITRHQPFYREFLGKGFSRLTNMVLGTAHSDITCGFKAFSAATAEKIFTTQKIDGWSFDAEILFLARRFNCHVTEIPVTWHDDPNSKVRVVMDIFRSLAELIKIRIMYL